MKTYGDVLLMSTHNMFLLRNKKNDYLIPSYLELRIQGNIHRSR